LKILCKGFYNKSWFFSIRGFQRSWASSTPNLWMKITLEFCFKNCSQSRFWAVVNWLWLYMLCPLTSYFCYDRNFWFDIQKEDWYTSNYFYNVTTLLIKHYNLSIYKWKCCVFFSYIIHKMSSLNLYGYNSTKFDNLSKLRLSIGYR